MDSEASAESVLTDSCLVLDGLNEFFHLLVGHLRWTIRSRKKISVKMCRILLHDIINGSSWNSFGYEMVDGYFQDRMIMANIVCNHGLCEVNDR